MRESSLLSARVLLEACPPAIHEKDKAYAVLRQSFQCYNSFHVVSVPDLQEAELGRTRDRVPNSEFAAWVRELTAKPVSLYKVCTDCTAAEFESWLDEAGALGCRDVFVVGGDSSRKVYRDGALAVGPAAAIAQRKGFSCGGIIIPTRRKQFVSRPASLDETERLIAKVREHGIRYYTTQILYEGEWMSCLLLDLVRRMQPDELPKVFLTFSPFVCMEDINFARKTLGVYVPRDVDRALRGARSMREASISALLLVWERLSTFAAEIGYPKDRLGVNVEYLDSRNPRNLDAAFELAEEFGRQLRR
jgi:5,10-methylenetetrahydrofolate reductase